MKVFALNYLEVPTSDKQKLDNNWSWTPNNPNATDIYASGKSTSSRESTYAAEKDSRSDSDRPNEGMHIA
ncbi:hypothetical protein MKX47_02910 [Solibacillus sp. FSL R7-0668]|uniref:hypothetical protein n=1 Tax=Solibacillus sp. FSL R7-0668 TaxID=2921688 RepID=UPI0030FAA255